MHATRKTLDEAGDKATDEEKESITKACDELEEAAKGSDKDDIEAKIKALSEVSAPLAQKLYAEQAQQAEGAADADAGQQKAGDDVVDAEFEEVDDDKKK